MTILLEPHGLASGQSGIPHHIVRRRSRRGSRISDIAAAVEVGRPAVAKTHETLGGRLDGQER